MVGRFDLKAHIFQRKDHITSRVLSEIDRSKVKVSCLFMGDRSRLSVIIGMEQEKFALRSDIERITHLCRLCDHFL